MEVFDDAFFVLLSHNDDLTTPGERFLTNEDEVTVKQFRENSEAFPNIKSITSLIVEAESCKQHIGLGSS